jgi:hypothetical protein
LFFKDGVSWRSNSPCFIAPQIFRTPRYLNRILSENSAKRMHFFAPKVYALPFILLLPFFAPLVILHKERKNTL